MDAYMHRRTEGSYMQNQTKRWPSLLSRVLAAHAVFGFGLGVAYGQSGTSTVSGKTSRSAIEAATESITITGTKKARRQFAVDAPVAVTAFGANQLDAFQFRDIESLTFALPNVSLDSVGTFKGVANFSIRGLGSNSSIPTIDPTVGLFVNGVYMGSNAGAVLDSFDLEAVEVLRGPQGVLFGRNVTGGAVLLRTKRPGDTYSASFKANVETGLEYRLYGAVDAPILPDLIKLRVAGQYRSDDGWFTNLAPVNVTGPTTFELEEQPFGEEETWLIRPTVTFTPTDFLTVHVTYEQGNTEASGPASQSASRANPRFQGPFDDFDFSIDEPGFADWNWNQVFTEAVLDLGNAGKITNIFGWRTVEGEALSDADAQPLNLLHGRSLVDITHFSNELRYSGRLFSDFLDLTAGLYVFSQNITYLESRIILFGSVDSTYGGEQDQLSLGAFSQLELNFTSNFSVILGGRVTYEMKEAAVVSFDVVSPCEPIPAQNCGEFPFIDDEDWFNFSPKVGFTWKVADKNMLYGHWTRGFRSGGYNLRNVDTDPNSVPGPFDEERQDAFELGFKGSLLDSRLRFSAAGFFIRMNDLQREVNIPAAGTGIVQIIRNTADANVYGGEIEGSIVPISNLVITGSFGYTDANYTDVRFDLNGDGLINDQDRDLSLPRLANITANIGALLDIPIDPIGRLTLRANYAYRDDSFFTDNNLGQLPSGHVVDASLTYALPDLGLGRGVLFPQIAVYGRNLLNEAFFGGQTPLPPQLAPATPPLGGNFSPLKEGRVVGAELRISWE